MLKNVRILGCSNLQVLGRSSSKEGAKLVFAYFRAVKYQELT